MNINTITVAYFSPTGNCKKLAHKAKAVLEKDYKLSTFDFTLKENRENPLDFKPSDLLILIMPVYAGRLPNLIMPYVKDMIKGRNTFAIPVVTYGNRSFDDGLSEMTYLLKENSFIIPMAAALPAEHAFNPEIATGRPSEEDLKVFGDKLLNAVEKIKKAEEDSLNKIDISDKVEGNMPPGAYYTPLGVDNKPAIFLKAKVLTHKDKCDNCGLCAKVCPVSSIDYSDFSKVEGPCIKCFACVKQCHRKAKYFGDENFLSHVEMLTKNYKNIRRVGKYFI